MTDVLDIVKKLDWVFDTNIQRYDDKKYIVYSSDFGLWTKKEAETIQLFLRAGNVQKIIQKAMFG